jgi:hypothetical protein
MEQNDWYPRYHFSVTCRTDDLGVLFCLRALCQVGRGGSVSTYWMGRNDRSKMKKSGGQSTFRFTDPAHRQRFIGKAGELLASRWAVTSQSDNDPASRQRPLH